MKAALPAIGADGRMIIMRCRERCERGAADALGPCFRFELLLPALETCNRVAALRGIGFAGHAAEQQEGCHSGCLELPALRH